MSWRTSHSKPHKARSKTVNISAIQTLHITGGSEDKREHIRQIIKDHFTPSEVSILQGADIFVSNYQGLDNGAYTIEFDLNKKGDVLVAKRPKITIYRAVHESDAMDHVTVIHEIVHHLRVFDTRRKGTQGRPSVDAEQIEAELDDDDLEEALTEAETVARQDPWQDRTRGGYYRRVNGNPDAAREHDRKVITESRSLDHPIIGVEAFTKTDKHFPQTEISKLKIEGKAESIDRFFYIKEHGKRGFTIFNTHDEEGTASNATVKRTFPKARSIYEFKDGKPVKLL